MKMKIFKHHIILAPVIALTTFFAYSQVASAQSWNFETCDSSTRTTVEHTPPAIMLMLDSSGSMLSRGEESQPWRSRWQVAVDAINGAVNELASDLHFGLGWFHQGTASIVEEASSTSANTIAGHLSNHGSKIRSHWGTPTAQAIQAIRTSNTMTDISRAAAGVLITDGYPSNRETAVTQACAMRDDDRQTLFVVGFSSGTDIAYNNKLAAAGGMRYTNSNGDEIIASCNQDPCSNFNTGGCQGSIQANDPTEFQSALATITNELQCVFPVDTSLHPEGGAPTDFNALRVRITGTMGADVTLRHKDHPLADPPGEGWYYPVPTNPNQIRLTEHYCELARNREIDEVETRLACPCDNTKVGLDCYDPDREFGVCKEGTWACESGFDYCEPLPLSQCEEKCPGWTAGEPCHMDLIPGEIALESQAALVAQERTRCLVGVAVCNEARHEPTCQRQYNPMPETCSGLDDDCDGLIDNLSDSWSKEEWVWEGKKYNWAQQQWVEDRVVVTRDDLESVGTNPNDYPQACYGEDLCRCRGSIGLHGGLSSLATPVNQFETYLENYTPGNDSEGCICVEN